MCGYLTARFTGFEDDLSADYELTSCIIESAVVSQVRRSEEGEGAHQRNGIDKSPKKNELSRKCQRPREKSVFDMTLFREM